MVDEHIKTLKLSLSCPLSMVVSLINTALLFYEWNQYDHGYEYTAQQKHTATVFLAIFHNLNR